MNEYIISAGARFMYDITHAFNERLTLFMRFVPPRTKEFPKKERTEKQNSQKNVSSK